MVMDMKGRTRSEPTSDMKIMLCSPVMYTLLLFSDTVHC